VVEESGIEDHTYRPTNVRNLLPEVELTLGKYRFLEMDSLGQ